MDSPSYVPSPEETLEKLSIHPHFQPAYDNAVFEATNYLETKALRCDTNTFLTLVRLHVKNYLQKLELDGIDFADHSLCGISFRQNGNFYRCWKGADHELPPPGDSGERRRFLNQQYPLPFEESDKEKIKNFVILWNLGPLNKVTLWLVCPKRYDEDERVAEAWWYIQIPEPATGIKVKPTLGQPPSDLDEIRLKQRPDVEKQGN